MNDPIVDEVRRIKDELAARFNYDLKAIYEHLKQREMEREEKTGRKIGSAPPREADSRPAAPAATGLGSADATLPEESVADPFVDEIRKYRDAHAARFNYDLKAIYEDIKRREKEWEKKLGRKFVSYAADAVEPAPKPAAAPDPARTPLPEGSPAPEH
jgi:hypothetical protein